MKLLVYNPEHDLCLANGNAHYVPPASAMRLAEEGAVCMLRLYEGEEHVACTVKQVGEVLRRYGIPESVTPWGWNAVLKESLLKAGLPSDLLPSDEYIDTVRRLQHRGNLLPLKSGCLMASSLAEVHAAVRKTPDIVLKSPWSGAGRGLRWVRGALTTQDTLWTQKIIASQGSVIVEPRRRIAMEFALEYMLDINSDGRVGECLCGYSLFEAHNGVYNHNRILTDSEIETIVGTDAIEECRRKVEPWISSVIAPYYHGPLGIDCYRTADGAVFISEHNMRHTMGMVAHAGAVYSH